MAESATVPAGWYPDYTGRHEQRYWDGSRWTEHVFSRGQQSVDVIASTTPQASASAEAMQAQAAPAQAAPSGHAAPVQEPVAVTAGPQRQPDEKVPFFGARRAAQEAMHENQRLQELIDRYGLKDVAELESILSGLNSQIGSARQALANEQQAAHAVAQERAAVQGQIIDLRNAVEMQEFGLYDFENPAESSVSLGTELEGLRAEIKQAVQRGQATSATANFTFNNSVAKGQKFVRDMSKLMLRAYNAEAENCIKTVRAGNLAAAQKRLGTAVDQIARLGTMIDLRVTPYFHGLRLRELELASRHLQALQVEKEMERARREELRQQRLAEQELAKEKDRLEKERSHYQTVLSTLESNGDAQGAERMRQKLADVERAIADVDYRAANIRAGYVYVISNIGSFGPDVVKIGMTRRLEPMDRVNELGDASVPFRFDVHALFFADDAVAVETALHQRFSGQRINRVNLRREYFRTTPAAVLEALKEDKVEVLEFTIEPSAPEYRSSVAQAVAGGAS
ncbi:DUF4041 domain-containing protein [Pseudolysinimonas sp.]|uniref:DUF4041 domain-containing protein n=1 Tax=Pseudolysinimonas sp. TaxID=2680009 RepID=UPI003F7F98DE